MSADDLSDATNDALKEMQKDGDVGFGKVSMTDIGLILNRKLQNDLAEISGKDLDLTEIYHLGNDGNLIVLAGFVVLTLLMMAVIHRALISDERPQQPVRVEDVEEEREPPRDFTLAQLREFNGVTNEKVYVALKGDVFDVSASKEYYGPGSTYDCFAGRDASRAMAKLSFEEAELSNPKLDDLGPFELDVLENWVEKFKYMKQYPIVGKLSYPICDREFTPEALWECRGYKGQAPGAAAVPGNGPVSGMPPGAEKDNVEASSDDAVAPATGRVHAEILIAVKGKVLDVSYGGVEMYGPGGPYQKFAGIVLVAVQDLCDKNSQHV
jgi:membrane-associated progesterone receptor component